MREYALKVGLSDSFWWGLAVSNTVADGRAVNLFGGSSRGRARRFRHVPVLQIAADFGGK